MTKKYISSDLHFFHKNILKFCPISRPFSSIEEMNEVIVKNINDKVNFDDVFYILGDISFGKLDETMEVLNQINCNNIILIKGNHDRKFCNEKRFRDRFNNIYQDHIEWFGEKYVHMYHFPILAWDRKHYKSYHLHGHMHSVNSEILNNRSFDVGMDGNNCNVWDINEVLGLIDNRMIKNEK